MCIIIYEIVSYEIDCQILKFVFAAVKFNENALQKSVLKKIYIYYSNFYSCLTKFQSLAPLSYIIKYANNLAKINKKSLVQP